MTWPLDNRPRFIVATCTGNRTTSVGGGRRTEASSHIVLDRAHNHSTIAEYGSDDHANGVYGWLGHKRAQTLAHQLADRLNQEQT